MFLNKIDSPIIREAFKQICVNKLLSDMYCDMEEYITGRADKRNMLQSLQAIKSPLQELYKKAYPTQENASAVWNEYESSFLYNKDYKDKIFKYDSEASNDFKLDFIEAKAIMNWIYQTYSNIDQRKEITEKNLPFISEMYRLPALNFAANIIYVKSKVEINVITSFENFCKTIQNFESPKKTFYYRGHSDSNYVLLPSVMRKNGWKSHEKDMYNELIIECAEDFNHCTTHLDYLVHMQHYGLPTRLLDITKNPLVALYFACESNPTKKGEVIVFDVDRDKIKYPGSDTATVLASLPLFSQKLKEDFANWAADPKISQHDFNDKIERLLHEVKLEKPAFKDQIRKEDIIDCFFVLSEKRNSRIIKQDGAFIICGLFNDNEKDNPINRYRYTYKKKIQIFIIEPRRKKGIMDMLNKFSINKACLFPEISDVTDFIAQKY